MKRCRIRRRGNKPTYRDFEALGATITHALSGALLRLEERHFSPMNRIRAARQALGWTQNDLALRAGVSARTIHAIEKGRQCRQGTKRKILQTLGVPWDLRDEYFVGARRVRRLALVEEARSA